jgi:hypothetical protein
LPLFVIGDHTEPSMTFSSKFCNPIFIDTNGFGESEENKERLHAADNESMM